MNKKKTEILTSVFIALDFMFSDCFMIAHKLTKHPAMIAEMRILKNILKSILSNDKLFSGIRHIVVGKVTFRKSVGDNKTTFKNEKGASAETSAP